MNRLELRKISLQFRRLSSNLLNSSNEDADINLSRFLKYINGTDLIFNIINERIKDVEFDFKSCFRIEDRDSWVRFIPPEDENCHIKAQYDYITYIDKDDTVNVWGQAMNYHWTSRKINDIIQSFLNMAVKPLIDFIIDQLSIEMLIYEEEEKKMNGNIYVQNIKTVNGSASQQNSGTITNYTTTNDVRDIITGIDKIINSLDSIEGIDKEEIENVKDDLEIVQEQLRSASPKMNRIKKAFDNIKKFANTFSAELAISIANKILDEIDWNTLLQQLENFIHHVR